MSWVLIPGTGEQGYVTCDNPVVYLDPTHDPRSPYGVGLLTPNVQVTMALSRKLALVAGWDEQNEASLGIVSGTDEWMAEINRRTVAGAGRFVWAAATSDPIRQLVLEYRDSAPTIDVVGPPIHRASDNTSK